MPGSRLPLLLAVVLLAAPAVHAEDPTELYVGLSQGDSSNRYSMPELRIEYLVLYADGTALRDIPPGGLDSSNVATYAKKSAQKVGRYTRSGDVLTIEWGGGGRKGGTWELRADGAGWEHGSTTLYRPASRVTPTLIKGIWQSARSGVGWDAANMGSGGEFVFRANGEFERGKGDSKRGQYALEGFTLVLHALDGSETRYAIYTWPWAGGSIGIERKMYEVIAIKRPTG